MPQPHFIVTILVTFFIATVVASGIAPIWMAPTNLNYPATVSQTTFDADVWENFTATLGEWATIEVATGARGNRALSVMDSKGIIWILAGNFDNGGGTYLTAVWNFNPKTDQYRYVWKTNNSSPFFARDAGELRVPSPSNHPGGIQYSMAVNDKDDNIWFLNNISELWMFNTTSWMFVRQSGSIDSQYGNIGSNPGQPGEDVLPGYTEGHCMVVDSNNDIWMLAGRNRKGWNTVWHFNMTSFWWTFVAGNMTDLNTHNSTIYGGTYLVGCDIDDNDRVWLYGGNGAPALSVFGDYGDLWSFDTRSKRQWEFENGENNFDTGPVVVADDYDPGNRPPAARAPVLIDRLDGTLMLVPGGSYVDGNYGGSNTVWQYSKSLKQWRLVYGDISALNKTGVYSNFRAPGSTLPGYLFVAKAGGKNSNGDLYLIVGSAHGSLYVDDPLPEGLVPNRKDIWLIPQDQCSNNLYSCDVNEECVEEMIGYSCKCKDGTCTSQGVSLNLNSFLSTLVVATLAVFNL